MLQKYIKTHIETINNSDLNEVEDLIKNSIKLIKERGRIFIFGNGGSATDSEHFTAEIIGDFNNRDKRKFPCSVICLSNPSSVVTSISNDYSYFDVFNKQLESHGVCDKDIVIGITTSGKSKNILKALSTSKSKGAYTVMLTGDVDKIDVVDCMIKVKSKITSHIQEIHGIVLHYYAMKLEEWLVENG